MSPHMLVRYEDEDCDRDVGLWSSDVVDGVWAPEGGRDPGDSVLGIWFTFMARRKKGKREKRREGRGRRGGE